MTEFVLRFKLDVPDDCAEYVRKHLQRHGMNSDVETALADGIWESCIAYAAGADAEALTDWVAAGSAEYLGMDDSPAAEH